MSHVVVTVIAAEGPATWVATPFEAEHGYRKVGRSTRRPSAIISMARSTPPTPGEGEGGEEMFKSLLKVACDIAETAAAPVEIAADLAAVVTDPVARAAREIKDGVKAILPDPQERDGR